MEIISHEDPQGPLSMQYMKMFSPTVNPVIHEFGSFGFSIVPVPVINVHVPTAGSDGTLPVKQCVFIGVQYDASGPASAITSDGLKMEMVNVSVLLPQGPL